MGLMDDIFKGAVQGVMFDKDLFPGVESVVYTPYLGTPRTIDITVDRLGQQTNGGKSISNGMEAWIQNHGVRGTLEINQRDTITIARELGETPKPRTIAKVFGDSDAATWHVQIQ